MFGVADGAVVCAAGEVAGPEEGFEALGRWAGVVSNEVFVDEVGAEVEHHGGFDLAGVADGGARAGAEGGELGGGEVPVGGAGEEGGGELDVEPAEGDVEGVDVASVAVEEEDAAESVFQEGG